MTKKDCLTITFKPSPQLEKFVGHEAKITFTPSEWLKRLVNNDIEWLRKKNR